MDTITPVISRFRASPRVFAAGSALPSRRVKRRTRFTYRLSEGSKVTFSIKRVLSGRKLGRKGKCRRPTRRNRSGRRCRRLKTVGRLTQSGKAGRNGKRFSGKIRRRRLSRGSYRAYAVAVDRAGNRSKTRRASFRVVRRRR